MAKRPHIIIFNPDEMRADTLAHLGNPAAITPHLDDFAKRDAVSFAQAHCQNPVCVPSRCSFFTGLYPHVHGHRTMQYLLRPGESSLFDELRESGYYVWMNGRNDLYAGQIDGWMQSHADELFAGGLSPKAPGMETPNIRGEQGGKQYYSHFHGKLKTDSDGRNYNSDDEAVDAAVRRLLEPVDDRPVCAFIGLSAPHTPYMIEEPYYSAIDRDKLPPRIRAELCSGKPLMQQLIQQYQGMQEYTEEDWNELRAVYQAMCMKVDEQFGRMCDALREAGIYDDCAIFVLSDHGDYTGDYGITEKAQNCFEDCLTRVPLLIKPPKNQPADPGVSESLVELVDFYATVLDYAQVKPNHTHFGKSLRPILENREVSLRDYVCSEGGRMPGETHCDEYHFHGEAGIPVENVYWPRQYAQLDENAHAKATMIRTEKYKYISRYLGDDEFYDLTGDPQEMHNQISNPLFAGEIAALQQKLLKWYQSTCDVVPHQIDNRFNKAFMWERIKARLTPEQQKDVLAKLQGGMKIAELARFL